MQPRTVDNRLKIFIFLLIVLIVDAKSHHDHKTRTLDELSRLLQTKPLIVLLNHKQESYASDELDSTPVPLYDDGYDSVERDSYLLFNLIKNTQDEEQLDSSAENQFENTKTMLRTTLRSRCAKRDHCAKKCSPKKPACVFNCQKVFDELNACEEATTCNQSTTTKGCKGKGKTMPPKWLRILRILQNQ